MSPADTEQTLAVTSTEPYQKGNADLSYTALRTDRVASEIVVAHLDRPDRLNAITFEMFDELIELQKEVDRGESARVLILTGSGRAFCAGLDLDLAAGLPDMPASEMLAGQEYWAEAISGFSAMRKPVIALVNGATAGAGLALALAADIRIATTAAKFNAAFVKVGLSGGDVGTSWYLSRLIGLGHAMEMVLTGRFVGSAEARDLGLVSSVNDPDDAMSKAVETAEMISSNSPVGMKLTKEVFYQNAGGSTLQQALHVENRNQVLATRTEDMK